MIRTLLSASALAIVLAAPVAAQQADRSTPAAKSTTAVQPAVVQQTSQIDSSKMIGRNIVNSQGERIGDVDSVLIGRDGKIQAVIVGVGGFLGMGEHKVAIDWNDLQVMDNGERVVANMTQDQLKAMPAFRYASDRDAPRTDRTERTAATSAPSTGASSTAASTNTAASGSAVATAPVTTAQNRAEANRTETTRADAARTDARPATADARAAATTANSTPASLSRMRADELIGKNVVNARGETVGEIEDIVIDKNKAVHAVLSVGGFLGLGDKDIAVPFDQLRLNQNNAVLMSEASEDQLKKMPEYKKGDNWRAVDRNQPVIDR